ncbi:MAG: glycosyltransferase family 2 protein [Candidatus Riflebacteria bacterium]|nr:glycosyltransferase family 2 protein [Candidatus Riflebacteria bacterium]
MTGQSTATAGPAAPDCPATGRLLVIIPAFNEECALPDLLASIPARVEAVAVDALVVNDGSADRTARVAVARGGRLVDLPFNVGIGAAVQAGFKYASNRGYSYAVQCDGDGQHPPDQIATLLAPVVAGVAEVTIGSRFLKQGATYQTPLLRRIGISAFDWVNSLVVGRRITDNTSGFRAYNRRAIEFLSRHYPHDYPEPEAVVLLARNGFSIEEVGIEMRERQGGRSSITFLRSGYYMLKVLLAIFVEVFRERILPEGERR